MAGPFKMKGSPMKRNFGIGSALKHSYAPHEDFATHRKPGGEGLTTNRHKHTGKGTTKIRQVDKPI